MKKKFVLFLDLKKAYDLVPHKRLIKKIESKGYGPKLIRFIKNMYENTECKVRVQDKTSKPFIYERGVRQGCPTSPDLFNIYIDDMLDNLKGIETQGLGYKVKGLHFADDTVIFYNTIKEMKINLDKIERWCDKNCMEINALKSG